MRDSAAAQSVEFRRQERPKLLPSFFGKERLSFAKSDRRRGASSSRMSASLSFSLSPREKHRHQAAATATGSALGLTCKYLLQPHSFLPLLSLSLSLGDSQTGD